MDHKTVMVREYTNEQDFHMDEQKLSREGWSVEPVASKKPSTLIDRLRSHITRKPAPVPLVVTYSRRRPS
jgi:hypothetical protein